MSYLPSDATRIAGIVSVNSVVNLTASTASTVATIEVPQNSATGGFICLTVEANDGIDFQSKTNFLIYSIINKNDILTIGVNILFGSTPSSAASVGGVTVAQFSIVDGGNGMALVKVTPSSTLNETVLRAGVTIFKNLGIGEVII